MNTSEPQPEFLATNYEVVSLTLVVQTFTCRACGKHHRIPADAPMVQLRSRNHLSLAFRHLAQSRWPYAIEDALPRRVVEAVATIEACEACFALHDPRQAAMFEPRSRNVPRQFLGDTELSGTEPSATAKKPPRQKITLDYF